MPDTPKTLYKYVTSDRALTCIPEVGNGTLRATQPAALNDPFECALIAAGSEVWKEKDELAAVLTAINARKPVTEQDVEEAQERHGGLFLRQLFADRISTKFGLISLAADPFHPLLWSHYTLDGSGFVIGYDVSELDNLVGQGGWLRAVQYEDMPPLIQTPDIMAFEMSNLPIMLSRKSHHWSYENEWRLIVELTSTIGTGLMDQHGQPVNLVAIPNEAVVSVYYTERTPIERVRHIESRLSDENNRYRAIEPHNLLMSNVSYVYYDPSEER